MKKNRYLYLIIPLIVICTIISNFNSKTISLSNKIYHGSRILRSSDYLKIKANKQSFDYEETDHHQMYEIEQNETDHTFKIKEYRYIGREANNYIYFNCQNDDVSSCEIWRIIGVFNVEGKNQEQEYRIKIIRDESIGKKQFDDNLNDYEASNLSDYLNNSYYYTLSSSAQKMIAETKYFTSGDNLENYSGEIFYQSERGKSTNKSVDFYGFVGLIYPSDYLYSYYQLDNSCYSNLGYCANKKNSWMYKISNNQLWTITPAAGTSNIYTISNNSNIDRSSYNNELDVYPVVYLKYNTIIDEGNGTKVNPYKVRSMNNSEIQSVNDMDKKGLNRTDVNVDDTLSTKSVVVLIISIIFILIGAFVIIKTNIDRKKNIKREVRK